MRIPEGVEFQPLPGSDALKTAPLFEPHRRLPYRKMSRFFEDGHHRRHLENAAYNQYLSLDKTIVDEEGAVRLQELAAELEKEELPAFLDAAGWAYAEAGIASREMTTVERVELIGKAEQMWARGLVNSISIGSALGEQFKGYENEGHRTAINLAFVPLMKSIVVGNVREEILHQTLIDISEIAKDSSESYSLARERGDWGAETHHKGLLYEASALMALLYMNDPRYVPLPSTTRGGSGYYYAKQTHDISLINQHWGEIRKVIPVEIKSFATKRAKRRYKALIISGCVRLSVGSANSQDTAEAFYNLVHTRASAEEVASIEQIATQLREMLRLYQQGITAEGTAINSLTRFYDSRTVAEQYPELSREQPNN